jgi:hypothetical protein
MNSPNASYRAFLPKTSHPRADNFTPAAAEGCSAISIFPNTHVLSNYIPREPVQLPTSPQKPRLRAICGEACTPVSVYDGAYDLGVPLSEDSAERLREKLAGLQNAQLSEAEVIKLLTDLISCGGGVSLELDELRMKLIRREGHFALKDGRLHSSLPPRTSRSR